MRKIVVSEAVTLDGVFEAQTMGQWAYQYNNEEVNGVIRDIVLAADAMVFGRVTYEQNAPYWSSLKNNEYGMADHLNEAPKFVASSTLKTADWNNSTIIQEDIKKVLRGMKSLSGQNILIRGSGLLVNSLMQAGMIDEFSLLVYPVVMGQGARLFRDGANLSHLKLAETRPLSSGVVLLRYTA